MSDILPFQQRNIDNDNQCLRLRDVIFSQGTHIYTLNCHVRCDRRKIVYSLRRYGARPIS